MDAVSIATTCYFAPCTGSGPWVEADLENGMFQGANGSNTANLGNSSTYVTALLKNNGQTTYALKGGNSQSGGLSTWWNGDLPNRGGYKPMQQEGSIILGTGGDNSNRNRGTFFEGVMTSGYPTDAADNTVQANIVAAGYSGQTFTPNGPQGTITGPGGKCVDVAADDTGVNNAGVQLWDCQNYAIDQHWQHFADNSLRTLGRCLDVVNNSSANDALVELYDCNGVGGQKWVQQADGSIRNPQSGRCLDSPNGSTANGVQLRIHDCNGAAARSSRSTGAGWRWVRAVSAWTSRPTTPGSTAPRAVVGLPVLRRRPALGTDQQRRFADARTVPGHRRERNRQRHPGRALGLQRSHRSGLGATG